MYFLLPEYEAEQPQFPDVHGSKHGSVLLKNTWSIMYFQYSYLEWLNFCIKQRRKNVLSKNPKRKDESFTEFFSIPFVKDWLKDHPRPPIPLSLLLSEEAASIVIQSFWRGYRVRCDSEIQELRQWQKQLRENKNIIKRVEEFWTKQEAKVFCLCWLLGKQMLFPGDLPLWNDFSPFLWEANWKTWKNPHEIIQHLNFSFLTNITKYRAHGLNFVVLI
uniref:IQ motif containing K n=1 Tax=Athene cunicularia TaxID=194338 RepID=A0A663N6P7_ATHCN